VSARVGESDAQPTLVAGGLAWQDRIAGRPTIQRSTEMLSSEAKPDYSWPTAENLRSV
jgi:hypothetical protein